jgi:uncharacterized protein
MDRDYSACIQTYSGIWIDLEKPSPEDILVPDVAHHLSNICRFTGAVRRGYSVAQHCCLVSKLVQEDHVWSLNELRLQGLLHDASEAYLGDVATPLKKLLPDYRILEDRMQQAVISRFDLKVKDFEHLKLYDRMALIIERQSLMGPKHPVWDKYKMEFPPDYDFDYMLERVVPQTPEQAEKEWLDMFNTLWLNRY